MGTRTRKIILAIVTVSKYDFRSGAAFIYCCSNCARALMVSDKSSHTFYLALNVGRS